MMPFPRLLCKALLAMAAATSTSAVLADAGTWPVWRGDPAMTGVAADSLSFPLSLAWKFPAAKPVKATPVSALMGRSPKTIHRSIHLTPFGEDFCRVCLPLNENGSKPR